MAKLAVRGILVVIMLIGLLFKIHGMWESHIEDTGIEQVAKANTLLKAGDPSSLQQAAEGFKKAIAIFQGMHKPEEARNEGVAGYNLARAYSAQKQYPQAIEAAQHALPLLTGKDAKGDLADASSNLGFYYIKTSQPDKAMEPYLRAEPLYQELGKTEPLKRVVDIEGSLLYDQAVAAARKKDWPVARDACIKAQEKFHQARNAADEADACHELALIYTVLGDSAKSAEAEGQAKMLRGGSPPLPAK